MPFCLASPLGPLELSFDSGSLCRLAFSSPHRPTSPLTGAPAIVRRTAEQLEAYWLGHELAFDLPLRLSGTPFQQAVWQELQHIPWGETRSYADLATSLGRPQAFRAVARAVGANPVAIIVPCHRVIGKNGRLTGYAGGLDRKMALLRLEGWHLQEDACAARTLVASRKPIHAMGK